MLIGMLGLTACADIVSRRDHEAEVQTEIAKRMASQIELFIWNQARSLELIVQVSGIANLPVAEQRVILSEYLSFDSIFDSVALLDNNGQEIVHLSPHITGFEPILQDRSDQPEFMQVIETRDTYYGPVFLDPVSADPLMTISVPFVDLRSAEVVYVLVGKFRFREIWHLIQAEDSARLCTLIAKNRKAE